MLVFFLQNSCRQAANFSVEFQGNESRKLGRFLRLIATCLMVFVLLQYLAGQCKRGDEHLLHEIFPFM